MKTKLSSIKFLHVLCILGEILTGLVTIAVIATIPFSEALVASGRANIALYVHHGSPDWGFNAQIKPGVNINFNKDGLSANNMSYGSTTIGPFRFNPDALTGARVVQQFKDQAVSINDVQGTVTFEEPQEAARALAATKWPFAIGMLGTGVLVVTILELSRRTLASVERGETFTAANMRNLYKIGFIFIGLSILKAMTAAWLAFKMTAYVINHLAIGNLTFDLSSGKVDSYMVMGLIILALAEVFRQGLALKEENSLTI